MNLEIKNFLAIFSPTKILVKPNRTSTLTLFPPLLLQIIIIIMIIIIMHIQASFAFSTNFPHFASSSSPSPVFQSPHFITDNRRKSASEIADQYLDQYRQRLVKSHYRAAADQIAASPSTIIYSPFPSASIPPQSSPISAYYPRESFEQMPLYRENVSVDDRRKSNFGANLNIKSPPPPPIRSSTSSSLPSSAAAFRNPIQAAILTRSHRIHYVDVPSSSDRPAPTMVEVGVSSVPLNIIFRSSSTRLNVEHRHDGNGDHVARYQESRSEDEPHYLKHTVTKPIVQHVYELIAPYRMIRQEVQPVQEMVQTIVARNSQTDSPNAYQPLEYSPIVSQQQPVLPIIHDYSAHATSDTVTSIDPGSASIETAEAAAKAAAAAAAAATDISKRNDIYEQASEQLDRNTTTTKITAVNDNNNNNNNNNMDQRTILQRRLYDQIYLPPMIAGTSNALLSSVYGISADTGIGDTLAMRDAIDRISSLPQSAHQLAASQSFSPPSSPIIDSRIINDSNNNNNNNNDYYYYDDNVDADRTHSSNSIDSTLLSERYYPLVHEVINSMQEEEAEAEAEAAAAKATAAAATATKKEKEDENQAKVAQVLPQT